jgi:succinate dehydrogenase / fumarate reductase, cytochrome b subunit
MLARVQALLGLIPLGGYLVYHLVETWSALDGREAWVERGGEHGPRALIVALVFLPLGLHGLLGLARLLRQPTDPLTGARGLRALQALTGLLALAFIAFHVGEVWSVGSGPHADARSYYAVVYRNAGQPLHLWAYLVGLTALCFHVGHGVSRAGVTFRIVRTPGAQFAFRVLGFTLGFTLWALLLQLLSHFAIGEKLF